MLAQNIMEIKSRIAIIFAGGYGVRFGNDNNLPKQFVLINNIPILIHTLKIFDNHKEIDQIYLVMLRDYVNYTEELIKTYNINKVKKIVIGGETSQDSIYSGLLAAAEENSKDSIVLIHDGVRPVVDDYVISNNIKSVLGNGNAITCTPCYETVLISNNAQNPYKVPIRRNTFVAQAPQSFFLKEIIEAHNIVRNRKERYDDIVDSCTMFNFLGKKTYMVEGNFYNIKLTRKEDVGLIETIMNFKKHEYLKYDRII